MDTCPLCHPQSETVLWHDRLCRVILAGDSEYSGFCRVIWQSHVKEMTDLNAKARDHFMRVVFAVEQALRDLMHPDKINLASLGNQTPHLHWHVIPRFYDDTHFPDPVWSTPKRTGKTRRFDREAFTQRLGHLLTLDGT
jgi:diadenosine tetraphosphate (Ap4A) HIT family hydrolase